MCIFVFGVCMDHCICMCVQVCIYLCTCVCVRMYMYIEVDVVKSSVHAQYVVGFVREGKTLQILVSVTRL